MATAFSGVYQAQTVLANFANYSSDYAGVMVDLDAGTVIHGGGVSHRISNIHFVEGSHFNDRITGASDWSSFVCYEGATHGVAVNLADGTSTGDGNDTFINIDNVVGSHFDDTVIGDGWTTVSYATANTGVTVDLSAGTATGDGHDTLSGIYEVIGSAHNDKIIGDNSNILFGGGGNNILNGGGGENGVDYSQAPTSVTVDLSIGFAHSNGYGGTDIISNIQDVYGSAHADHITGDSGANQLYGGDGNNVIYGGAGNDELYGGTGNDRLDGGDGNDYLTGGAGHNILNGGTGRNTIIYEDTKQAVTLDLSAEQAHNNGFGGHDTITNVQNVFVEVSNFNNHITGDSVSNCLDIFGDGNNFVSGGAGDDNIFVENGNNTIHGGDGNDWITVGTGNNVIDGGAGTDTLDFFSISGGVTVDLSKGTATVDGGGTSSITNIENVWGGPGDSHLTGDKNDNVLFGGSGNTTFIGGAGNDEFEGTYLASNTADYSHDPAGVTVNLPSGTATDGWGNTDTLYYIQNVTGSVHGDTLIGDSGDNVLYGGGENDYLTGGAGADNFLFDATALTGMATISDFSASQGDMIDMSSWIQEVNPLQDDINNFVQATQQDLNTVISVDPDGASNGAHFTPVITLQDVQNFDVADMVVSHNLNL